MKRGKSPPATLPRPCCVCLSPSHSYTPHAVACPLSHPRLSPPLLPLSNASAQRFASTPVSKTAFKQNNRRRTEAGRGDQKQNAYNKKHSHNNIKCAVLAGEHGVNARGHILLGPRHLLAYFSLDGTVSCKG